MARVRKLLDRVRPSQGRGVTALVDCADEHSAGAAAFLSERALRASELAEAVAPLIGHAGYVLSAMDIAQNISDAQIEGLSDAGSKAERVLSELAVSGE